MIMPVISARISLHWHSCCSFFQVQTTSWPPCTCSTPPFRDLLPGHCAALAVIVHPALAPAEPRSGARSPSSSIPAAAARASAEPSGGKRSPSSRSPVAARRHRVLPSPSARLRLGPPLQPWFPLLALTLRLVGGSSQLGPAWLWLAGQGRSRRKGEIYSAPKVLETTNRYNENDGVSKRVQELAFGIVICFGLQLPGRD